MRASAPPAPLAPFRWSPGKTLQRLGLLVFILLVLSPLALLSIQTIRSLMGGNDEWLRLALPVGRRLGLFLNSLGFALSVAIAGVVLGILGGLVLWRWDTGRRSYLRWLVLVLAPVPPYIHALAWSSAFFKFNTFLQGFGWSAIPLQGWLMSWWIQLMALAPLALGLALVGLKSVEPLMIDAARTMRSDFAALSGVILPLALPFLLAAGGVLFLLSLLDYSVPSLLNLNVYSLEIFSEFSASSEPVRAFLLSVPLLVIAAAVMLACLQAIRHAAQSPAWRNTAWQAPPVWPDWFNSLQWLAAAALIAQVAVPAVSLTTAANTWHNLTFNIASAQREIAFSFWVDTMVILISLPIAFAVAREIVSARKKWQRSLWILVILPLAVPPPLIGIGLITFWNRPLFAPVYGTGWMPVLAGLVRFAPLAVIVLVSQLRRINPLLIDAAHILQPGKWQTWRRIWLPLLAPGILAAAGIVFALTTGELGATLLVAPPGQATLTMRIYNFLHYGASDTVAGLCLMMAAITLTAAVITVAALMGWSNFSPKANMSQK